MTPLAWARQEIVIRTAEREREAYLAAEQGERARFAYVCEMTADRRARSMRSGMSKGVQDYWLAYAARLDNPKPGQAMRAAE